MWGYPWPFRVRAHKSHLWDVFVCPPMTAPEKGHTRCPNMGQLLETISILGSLLLMTKIEIFHNDLR